MTRTLVKIGIVACTLSAPSAFAFFGTEIENYRPNPWLDRPVPAAPPAPAREATSGARGSTQPAAEAVRPASRAAPEAGATTRESESERTWREMDQRSRYAR